MTDKTRKRIEKIESDISWIKSRLQIPEPVWGFGMPSNHPSDYFGYGPQSCLPLPSYRFRDSSLNEVLDRVEELYAFLGVKRETTPSKTELKKADKPRPVS